MSTRKRILKDALEAARDIYLEYRVRQKNGLPVVSKRFASVVAQYIDNVGLGVFPKAERR